MILGLNGLLAVLGWASLVALWYAQAPFSTAALILVVALLLGGVASVLLVLVSALVLRGFLAQGRRRRWRARRRFEQARPRRPQAGAPARP